MILFMVEHGAIHVIVTAPDREEAKRKARDIIRLNPDDYTVTPLTKHGDYVYINVAVA